MQKIHNFVRKTKERIFGSNIDKLRKRGAKIGTNVHIFGSSIDSLFPFLIEIGNNTTLTGVTVLAHDASTKKELGFTKIGKVTIGNNCFVGRNSVILPNVTIGDNCIIGAGSIVTKNIPENSVAVGAPCKVIKEYSDYMTFNKGRMNEQNTIDKSPSQLTDEEKKTIKSKINGIWYIR